MQGVLLTSHSLVSIAMSNAGLVLFGVLIFVYGSALTTSLLLKFKPRFAHILVAEIITIILLLLGIVVLDIVGTGNTYSIGELAKLSETFATHRWLIIQLPFVLLATALINLFVYSEKIIDNHAKEYRRFTIACVWISFGTIILIALESLF